MTKEDLISLISEKLQVTGAEEQLCFRVFVDKISEMLNKNEAVRLAGIGVFQLKQESVSKKDKESGSTVFDRKYTLIYSPMTEDFASDSKSMFLKIDVPNLRISSEFDESVFSIGVNKPLVPFTENLGGDLDNETSYLLLRKTIEERVNNLLEETEKLENFDLWDDYLSTKKSAPAVFETDETEVAEEDIYAESEEILPREDDDSDEKEETGETETENPEPEPRDTEPVKETPEIPSEIEEEDLSQIEFEDEEPNEDHVELLNEILSDELDIDLDETGGETVEAAEPEEEIPVEESIEELLETEIPEEQDDEIPQQEESEEPEDEENAGNDDLLDIDFDEPDEDDKQAEQKNPEPEEDETEDGETVEEMSGEVPAGGEDFDETELNDIPEIKKRKFKFGGVFWIIVGAFIIINLGAAYFIFFSGGSEENAEGTESHEIVKSESGHEGENKVSGESEHSGGEGEGKPDESQYKMTLNGEKKAKSGTEENIDDLKLKLKTEDQVTAPKVELQADKSDSLAKVIAEDDRKLYQEIPEEKKLPNSNIWYDGNRYNLQLSSWKRRAKAESEVKRIRSKGYNAFITQIYLEKFGGTYYRVKVGYFDTEKEAREIENKIK